jgi:hypothetical protein
VLSVSEVHKRELGYYNGAFYGVMIREFLKRYYEEIGVLVMMVEGGER